MNEAQIKNWKVVITKNYYGYFENQVTGANGGLWFDNGVLVDYDGCFELPESVKQAVIELGYKLDRYI